MTIKLLLATPEPLHAQTMAVLIDIYYDLTCRDLAPEFEDRHATFFAEGTSYFCTLWRGTRHSSRQRYVVVASLPLDLSHFQSDEPTPSLPSRVRAGVIEIAEVCASPSLCFSFDCTPVQLYVKMYPEVLMRSRSVAVFIKAVWELVSGGKQLGLAYDQASICFPSGVFHLLTLTHEYSSYPNLSVSSPPRSALAPIAISSRRPIRSKGSSQE